MTDPKESSSRAPGARLELIDTHAHLGDPAFDGDRDEVLTRAGEAGVVTVVEIADSPEEWDRAVALSRARPERVRCSLGLHPYYADRWEEPLGARLLKKASLPEVVAAGEIGLDYARCDHPPDTQKRALLGMLQAADRAGLPVVIHCRAAYDDILPLLRDFYGSRSPRGRFHGVLHCFSGDEKQAAAAVKLGFAIGVDGPVTYPKNDGLRRAVAAAGLDAVVLETDCPYLPPQSSRGKRNEPRAIPEIARAAAAAVGFSPEEAFRVTTRNARDLYGLTPRDTEEFPS